MGIKNSLQAHLVAALSDFQRICQKFLFLSCGLLLMVGLSPCHLKAASPQRGSNLPGTHEASQGELENRSRMEIKLEELKQKDVNEAFSELEHLVATFTTRWSASGETNTPRLTEDDQKHLKKIEKLARKIRNNQGGDEDETIAKNLPATFPEQVKLLSKSTDELKENLGKSSRHVISVGIITRTTRIILLTKLLSTNGKK